MDKNCFRESKMFMFIINYLQESVTEANNLAQEGALVIFPGEFWN